MKYHKDIDIRTEGRAGRITLMRPDALNALTYDMCLQVSAALRDWRDDDDVACVVIDALGDRAFCAGGDIAELYATGKAGDFAYGRNFWRDEYRMNAMIANYPKPVQSFLQGFTMGGGVGLGCHAGLRIVGESSQIALPECGIGLIPDVGGSHILARIEAQFPGAGAWIGLTGLRLDWYAASFGFADRFQPEDSWDRLKEMAIETGTPNALNMIPEPPDTAAFTLRDLRDFPQNFCHDDLAGILRALGADGGDRAGAALKALHRASPLSLACHLEILRRLGPDSTIEDALRLEFRFAWRSMEHGDFLEGIRAQIIDKDRTPKWRHGGIGDVTRAEVEAMLAPLGEDELTFE